MEMDRIKSNISKNIMFYRKRFNLTQAQLGEKINYSDKAISKWERGDGCPDTFVLVQLCEFFSISLNQMIYVDPYKKHVPTTKVNKFLISLLSVVVVWIVAILVFVLIGIIFPNGKAWLTFIYALPATSIVLVVFTSLWANKVIRFLSITSLIWMVCLSLFLTLDLFLVGENYWMVFLIGIPVQLFFIFGFLLKKDKGE